MASSANTPGQNVGEGVFISRGSLGTSNNSRREWPSARPRGTQASVPISPPTQNMADSLEGEERHDDRANHRHDLRPMVDQPLLDGLPVEVGVYGYARILPFVAAGNHVLQELPQTRMIRFRGSASSGEGGRFRHLTHYDPRPCKPRRRLPESWTWSISWG